MAADVVIDIDVNSKDAKKELRDLNKDLKKTEDQADKTGDNLDKNFAKTATAAAAAAVAIGLIVKGVSSAVNAAIQIEDLETQFIAFTGSAEAAADQVERLAEFSAGTPFQLEDLANANRTLLAFGSSTEESLEQLRQLGEVAAATGNDIGELATIFGQIDAAGKLTGERFNQLVERGVNIGPVLAKSLGVAESSLEELRKQGKITSEDVAEAFRTLTSEGGQFFGATERQSKTLSGSLSTLDDNFTQLSATVGKLFTPAIVSAANATSQLFKEINQDIKGFLSDDDSQRTANRIETITREISSLETQLNAAIKQVERGDEPLQKFFSLFTGNTAEDVGELRTRISELRTELAALETQQAQAAETTTNRRTQVPTTTADTTSQEEIEENKARELKLAEIERQITENIAREQGIRRALISEEGQALTEEAINALETREAEITAKRVELETQKLEIQGQFDEAAIAQAVATEEAITAKREEEEKKRLAIIRQAQDDEFNFAKITAQRRKQFDEQTFAQRVQTANAGLNALISLQRTGSREGFEIAKAANIAQSLVSIPTTAIEAYKALAGIPVVGPGLGAAAAAAATAAGVANLNRIRATKFQEGGRVPEGFDNDSFPALLSSGEVVVPEKNFEQIQRERQPEANTALLEQIVISNEQIAEAISSGNTQPIQVTLTLDSEVLANQILDLNQDNVRLA